MTRRGALQLAIATFLVCIVLPIHAYNVKSYKWNGDPTMKVATVSFPSGSVWRDDLETGVGRWNGLWGMWLEFDLTFSNYSTFSLGDGDNNVAFVSASDVDGNWAVHSPRKSGSKLKESDIMFNADITWRTGAQNERIRNTDFPSFIQAGVVHEFGHSVGLLHENGELANMAQGFPGHIWYGGGNTYRHHPTPDDCQGSRALFPFPSNSDTDASATNFEMSGSSSTQIWRANSTNTVISPGGSVSVEYTVTNAGNIGIDFNARVYLSTNPTISKFDTYVGGFIYHLPAHYAWERDKTFTVPASIPAGTYYMGLVLDTENELKEDRESNNTLLFPGTWEVR